MGIQIPRDRPDNEEIEVTPEMIEAGTNVLGDFAPSPSMADLLLPKIFRAMVKAAKGASDFVR